MHRATAVAALLTLAPAPALGQFTLLENDDAALRVGGYVQTFTGIHDRGFDLPAILEGPPRTSGFHGQVLRIKWHGAGPGWEVDVHQRLQARVTSGAGEGPVLGLGVSAVPDRLVDLDSDIVREPGLHVWHDIDRAALTLYTPVADITAGRQAITWGTSSIFPVADLWATFSPFELDTEEKPGLDAVRALFYPADGLEMDAVLADRGTAEDLSFGLRGTYALSSADVWAGAGKFWREALVMGGVTVLLDEIKVRAEAVLPYRLDPAELDDPRATVGVDWIRGTLFLSGEYHYNGIGSTDPEGYAALLRDERLARGETYYLGRHYLGSVVSWSPDQENRLSLSFNALANLGDGSAAFTPIVGYDLGQATRLSVGALLSLGASPSFDLSGARLDSEFGTYGDLVFTRLAVYF